MFIILGEQYDKKKQRATKSLETRSSKESQHFDIDLTDIVLCRNVRSAFGDTAENELHGIIPP